MFYFIVLGACLIQGKRWSLATK